MGQWSMGEWSNDVNITMGFGHFAHALFRLSSRQCSGDVP